MLYKPNPDTIQVADEFGGPRPIQEFDIEYGTLADMIHVLPPDAFEELLAIPNALARFFRAEKVEP